MKRKNSISSTERHVIIIQIVNEKKHISVDFICSNFNVSQATARRDLDLLHEQAALTRVHGGAIAVRKSQPESPLFQRMEIQTENKQKIGLAAAELIGKGDTVFLGSGTTVYEVAKNLKNCEDITVITNSLLVINELVSCRGITLVALGGIVRHSEQSMIGHIAESSLSGLFADIVIIGIHGIDVEQGLTNHHLPEAVTDRKILEAGKRVFIVADHSKCGMISVSKVAPLSVIDTLVTDEETPTEFVNELKMIGIRVIRA
jgi:DeoR/GlpR family transcriptional regulator of sugar metabolism